MLKAGFRFDRGRLESNLRLFAAGVPPKIARSVLKTANHVLGRARELCPRDKGDLVSSGEVVVSPEGLSATVRFGGPGIPYAVAVHEHLSPHSPYSWRVAETSGRGVVFTVGGPKFLETPMLEDGAMLGQNLREEFKH